jgi:hypothetical protein
MVLKADVGTKRLRDTGRDEFYKFVHDTYEALAKSEARQIGGLSSIAVFCRMDIGILIDEEGQASYFVNEVERTPTTSLWSQNTWVPINMFANTLGWTLHNWLTSITAPFINSA